MTAADEGTEVTVSMDRTRNERKMGWVSGILPSSLAQCGVARKHGALFPSIHVGSHAHGHTIVANDCDLCTRSFCGSWKLRDCCYSYHWGRLGSIRQVGN